MNAIIRDVVRLLASLFNLEGCPADVILYPLTTQQAHAVESALLHQGLDTRQGAGDRRIVRSTISPLLVTEMAPINDDSNDGWSISTLQEADPIGYVLNNGW